MDDDRLRLEAAMWKAGQHLSKRLNTMLGDLSAQSITLDRDEALLALSLIDAAVDALEHGLKNGR